MGHKPNPARPAVLRQWAVAFGALPPPFLSVSFMQQALDYEAQCKRAGGLSAPTRRVLAQIARGRPVAAVPLNAAKPGTHYARE
ncbi:MAG: hypothetical protein OSA45_16665 [Halioglobus sp.]|nr:hypothetical protein [Halioglobus sp.]MDE2634073.1 hypothetical protein [Paracoccaceae bacterium]